MLKFLTDRSKNLAIIVASVIGAFSYGEFLHDWYRPEGGRIDDLFHIFYGLNFILSPLYVISILCLLWHLSKRVGQDTKRIWIVALTWCLIGLFAFAVSAYATALLQELFNNDAYKRLTPEDYLYWIGPRDESDPSVLSILDNPNAFDDYSWFQLTLREVTFLLLTAFIAAWSLMISSRFKPAIGAFGVPLSVSLSLTIYVQLIAPWAYIFDYDVFVGDRILGSVTSSFFVFSLGDPIGPMAVYLYVVSIIFMVIFWKPIDVGGSTSQTSTA